MWSNRKEKSFSSSRSSSTATMMALRNLWDSATSKFLLSCFQRNIKEQMKLRSGIAGPNSVVTSTACKFPDTFPT